jgi:cyanophycinase
MAIHLIGGGWDAGAAAAGYGGFLAEAAGVCRTAPGAAACPRIACVVLDEGDGERQFERWATAITAVAGCRPVPVLVPEGGRLDVSALGDAHGLLVCGGLTPGYADALAPAAADLREWLAAGRPYAGFSAGAAIAARRAIVGGWREGTVPVCPQDAAEDLDQVTVVDGLGLLPLSVDVHAAQWGTLPRLLAALRSGAVPAGVALDENTALVIDGETATVRGIGAAHLAGKQAGGVVVRTLTAGATFDTLAVSCG